MTNPVTKRVTNTAVTVPAPAKLTLSLRVTGVRADGFHLIDAEMVSLDVLDTLRITQYEQNTSDQSSVTLSGPFAKGISVGPDNLVLRALKLCGRRAHVEVEKQIPSGSGLGGGSTDAAAVLRWAGFTDLQAASKLGADIAFCLVGGHARVQGIGEILEPLPVINRDITLVIPPFGVSTPAVYKAFDELTQMGAVAIASDNPNDLEPAAMRVEPRLATWKKRIAESAGCTPILAGSGSTWWLEGSFGALATELPEATVLVTRTNCYLRRW